MYDTFEKETQETFEDYTFVLAQVFENKYDTFEFEPEVEELGKGIENAEIHVDDRWIINTELGFILIVEDYYEE